MNKYYVYLTTNRKRGVIRSGVTGDLYKVLDTNNSRLQGWVFGNKSIAQKVVYIEAFSDMCSAMLREKQIDSWKRAWKIKLIESKNKKWDNISTKIAVSK